MAKISTTIELQDRMTQVLNRINNSLNTMNIGINDINDNINQTFNDEQIQEFQNAIGDAQASVLELENTINSISTGAFNGLTQGAMTVASTIGNVLGKGIWKVIDMAVSSLSNFIETSTNLYKAQENAQTQLPATLKNTSEDAEASFNRIIAKSSELAGSGMYSQSSLIAAGAEFATYFSDNDAIDTMMETLVDYAAGMSGGGAIDDQAMVNYATNIAKMTTGAYDAMTKKGFEVTEAQKAILEGEDEIAKAQTINQIIAESWDGMYEAMSDTPEGKILSLTNEFNDLMTTIGGELLASFNQVYEVIQNNWDTIKMIIQGVSDGLRVIISVFSVVLDYVLKGIQNISNFFAEHGQTILDVALNVAGNIIGAFNVVKTFFTNLIADIQGLFWGFLATVSDIVIDIAKMLNVLPFVNLDIDGIVSEADSYRQKSQNAFDSKTNYGDAFQNGKDWVNNLAGKVGSFIQEATAPLSDNNSFFNSNQSEIATNTANTVNALDKNSEELEYLKDYAEQEVINRFTTAEIKVEMGGINQNINKDTDADGVVDYLVSTLEKSMSAVAEGVY